jgi:signal transduction histidine kinase
LKGPLFNQQKVLYTVISLAVIILFLLNLWGWLFLNRFENELLLSLSQQTQRSSEVYALLIGEKLSVEEGFLLPQEGLPLISIQQLLFEFRETGNLETIFIVSPDRKTYITPDFSPESEQLARKFQLNDSLFQEAQTKGESKAERIFFHDTYFLTTYTPILNEFGVVIGILVIEAPADIFNTLYFFRNTAVLTAFIGLVILLGMGIIIILAIRQLFIIRQTLEHKSRLAQLGQMAAMVAHEIRNPLSIIKGTSEVLRKKYQHENDEMFDFIPEEINRLNRLVSDFLQFARQKEIPLSKGNIVESVEKICSQIGDKRIQFKAKCNSANIMLNEDALRQILYNIIDNALQATPAIEEGGLILVKLTCQANRPRGVIIEIIDNGKGMPQETVSKIFEPFFSTRATGSGLGMAITKQLVEQMNGTINVTSEPNCGTTVRILFPSA